jgi:hypothetical protein
MGSMGLPQGFDSGWTPAPGDWNEFTVLFFILRHTQRAL